MRAARSVWRISVRFRLDFWDPLPNDISVCSYTWPVTQRRIRLWTLWLLPVIAARAFMPIGVMVSAQANGLALTLCPGVISAPLVSGATHADGHEGHAQHHGAGDEGSSNVVQDVPCPFALVAFAAAANIPQVDAYIPEHDVLLPDVGLEISPIGPPRADRARAPPNRSHATIV